MMKRKDILLFLTVLCLFVHGIQATGQVNYTSFITNPDFESEGTTGWTIDRIDGGNVTFGPQGEDLDQKMIEAIGKTNHCFEAWRCHKWDVWQEIENLPAGNYALQVQGFIRCEEEGYDRGGEFEPVFPSPVMLYMNDATSTFPNVYSENPGDLGHTFTIIEDWTVDEVNGKYYPNSMGGAAQCFAWGMYKAVVYGSVAKKGDKLRIGVKMDKDQDWWCSFDNFELTYYGSEVSYEDKTFTIDNVRYHTISANEVEVVWDGTNGIVGELVIPQQVSYEGKSYVVKAISKSAFCYWYYITSVIIPNTVTSIEREAFLYCGNLNTVVIPSSVKSIGTSAFGNNSSLRTIIVSSRQPFEIDEGAFPDDVYEHATLYIPQETKNAYQSASVWKKFKTIKESLLYTVDEVCDGLVVRSTIGASGFGEEHKVPYRWFNVKDNRLYERSAFGGSEGKEFNHYITVWNYGQRETVDYWGTDIDNVVYLSEAEDIPGMKRCNNANTLIRSSNCASAYAADGNVEIIRLPAGDYKLSAVVHCTDKNPDYNYQFLAGDKVIADFHCDEVNIQRFESGTFTLTEETPIYIPQGGDDNHGIDLIYITKETTFEVGKLRYKVMVDGKNVTVVGHNNMTGVLNIPSQVAYDGQSYAVTSIGRQAFGWCGGITSVTIPASVTHIGSQAFMGCWDCTTVSIPSSVLTIDDEPFSDCQQLTSINVDANNPNYCSVDGVLFTRDMERLINYPAGKDANYYVVPDGVETLGGWCFVECHKLNSIVLPASFKYIWWRPFESSENLTSVTCLMEKPFEEEYDEYMFDTQIYGKATLWVPQGCAANYQSRSPWNKFKAIRELPSQITVKAKDCTMTYGDNPPSDLEIEATDGPLFGKATTKCVATKTSKVGTYDITIEQGSVSSVVPVKLEKGKLTVEKAPLTTYVGYYERNMGESNPVFTVKFRGFKNNDTENVVTVKPTATCDATPQSPAGKYPITISGGQAANYTFNYVEGELTVLENYTLSITVLGKGTIGYNGTQVKDFGKFTLSAGTDIKLSFSPDTDYLLTQATMNGKDIMGSIVGSTYSLNDIHQDINIVASFTQRGTVSVVARNVTITYGDEVPKTFEYDIVGGSATGKPTLTCTATKTSSVGTYDITVSKGTLNSTAALTFVKGTLTIEKAPLTARVGNYERYEGEANPTFSISYEGFRNGQSASVIKKRPIASCSADAKSPAGKYPITLSGGEANNYTFNYVDGELTVKANNLLTISTRGGGVVKYGSTSVRDYQKFNVKPGTTFTLYFTPDNGYLLGQVTLNGQDITASITNNRYTVSNISQDMNLVADFVERGTVTVAAQNVTITYGDEIPKNFDYTLMGGTATGKPTLTCSATNNSPAGTYDIVVSKGTLNTTATLTFVKGTLTIEKAPLTVWVDNYQRYEGQPNPTFDIYYSGFRKGQTANVLKRKPVASCTANAQSPAGTYPITLSGGEADNYAINYVNGELTVIANQQLSISPQGHGSVWYNNVGLRDYSQFAVNPGSGIRLAIVPDEGYYLSQLTMNGSDVLGAMSGNSYTFTMNQDVSIIAVFSESLGNFTEGGISYEIVSSPDKTVTVAKGNYSGMLTIPESFSHDGQYWHVVGVQDNAFNNCGELVCITMPATLHADRVGISLFTGCSSLAAVRWNADFAMTSAMLGAVSNPNLLFYAKQRGFAPSGVENVVVNGQAEIIVLHDVADGSYCNFYCPQDFTAQTVSYTHNYSMTSAFGGIGGWETLALPFTVQQIEHSREGAIVPFAAYDANQLSQRPFWLYTWDHRGYVRTSVIEANRAYIICMPNNSEYDNEYRLNGTVTFSAKNARIEMSSWNSGQKSGNKEFCPAFLVKRKSASVYALNVSNDLHSETGGRMAGSAFISDLRDVSPFEAYMAVDGASARKFIEIDFGSTTDIDELPIQALTDKRYRVFNLAGQLLISAENAAELEKALKLVSPGVYIVNGKKTIIK